MVCQCIAEFLFNYCHPRHSMGLSDLHTGVVEVGVNVGICSSLIAWSNHQRQAERMRGLWRLREREARRKAPASEVFFFDGEGGYQGL